MFFSLFAWQFLVWAMPNFHKQAQEYVPIQDEILQAIENSGLKQGMYVLGQPDLKFSGPESGRTAFESFKPICFYLRAGVDIILLKSYRFFISLRGVIHQD